MALPPPQPRDAHRRPDFIATREKMGIKSSRLSAFTHSHGDPSLNEKGLTDRSLTQTLPSSSIQSGEHPKRLENWPESLKGTEKLGERLLRGAWASQFSPLKNQVM